MDLYSLKKQALCFKKIDRGSSRCHKLTYVVSVVLTLDQRGFVPKLLIKKHYNNK